LAVRQIVSRAISSDKVIDIFDAAGLYKPDISILSDEFLAEVKHLPQRNLAVELLQKLLNNELKIRSKKYLVQSRSFAEMLEATIRKYQNRTIEAAQVIAELIELAKQMREINVPQGQPKIARRFNAGMVAHGHKSRRDDRKPFPHDRIVCRPSGTWDNCDFIRH
jgi:type I site-specific restriction-modification system R (restriction) subunit